MLYSWFPLSAVILFLLLIARFYQKFSGERTFFGWYGLPLILFAVALVRYASIEQVVGDPLADLLMGAGGLCLLLLSAHLLRLMVGGRET